MANYASELIKVAEAEVGYLEKETNKNLDNKKANAGDENYTKYARDFDNKYPNFYNGKKNGYAWCDVFVDWCFVKAFGVEQALKLLGQPLKSYGAGCSWSANYYKKIGCFSRKPKVGAQIFFADSKGEPCHTGIVYQVGTKYVYTIEGNTSSAVGVVSNGGAVAKKKYTLNYSRIYGYGIPKFDKEPSTPKKVVATTNKTIATANKVSVKDFQISAIADGFKFPKYGADGSWGKECESVAKRAVIKKRLTYKYRNLTKLVQKVVGVKTDGLCGKETQAAIKVWQKKNNLKADGIIGLASWRKMLGIK